MEVRLKERSFVVGKYNFGNLRNVRHCLFVYSFRDTLHMLDRNCLDERLVENELCRKSEIAFVDFFIFTRFAASLRFLQNVADVTVKELNEHVRNCGFVVGNVHRVEELLHEFEDICRL